MNSPESLKGKINYISKQNNLRAQEVLHMYFFERVLDRLEKSKFKMHFIIKGGLLIASLIGLESRTTLDMDTTVKGIPLRKKSIRKIINAIITVEINDGIDFEFNKTIEAAQIIGDRIKL